MDGGQAGGGLALWLGAALLVHAGLLALPAQRPDTPAGAGSERLPVQLVAARTGIADAPQPPALPAVPPAVEQPIPADRDLPAIVTDTLPARVKQHALAPPVHATPGRTGTVLDEAVVPRRVPPPRPLALGSSGVPEASPAPPRAVAAMSSALPPPRAPVPPPTRRTAPVDDVPVTATAPRDQPVLPAKDASRSTATAVLEQPLYGTAQRATHLAEARQGPALQELAARLHHAIETHKHYPLSARRLGREGTVEVAFLLRPDGLIGDLELAASSGTRVLDSAALRAVESIAPFAPARGYLDAPARFRIAIAFSLR